MKAALGSRVVGGWTGVLTLGVFASVAEAQKTQTTFDYGIPTVAEDVAPVQAFGACEFALVGSGTTPTGDSDVFVSRHLAAGGVMWARRVAGTPTELAMSVVGAVNGDILAAFTSSRGMADMATVIARFDLAGNLIWANHYPGAVGAQIALAEAANGDVVAVSGYSSATGSESVFIRVTSAGVPIAIRRYAGDPATGTQQPQLFGLHEFAGFWYLIGNLFDTATTDSNIFLMGVDATGLPIATLGYASTIPGVSLFGRSIDVDPVRGLVWTAQVVAPFAPPLLPTATLSVRSDLLGTVGTTNVFFDSSPGRRVFWDPRFDDAVFASNFLFPVANVGSCVATRDFGGGSPGNSELYYDLSIPGLFTFGNSIASPACDQDVVVVGAFQAPASASGSAMYFVKAESVLASGCRDFAFFPQTLASPLVQSPRSVIMSNDVRVAAFAGVFAPVTPVTTVLCTASICPRPQPACPADLDDGSMTGTPDGGVTISDLLYFLNEFGIGTLNADVDDGLSSGDCDGGVTISDLLYFLTRFQVGC